MYKSIHFLKILMTSFRYQPQLGLLSSISVKLLWRAVLSRVSLFTVHVEKVDTDYSFSNRASWWPHFLWTDSSRAWSEERESSWHSTTSSWAQRCAIKSQYCVTASCGFLLLSPRFLFSYKNMFVSIRQRGGYSGALRLCERWRR